MLTAPTIAELLANPLVAQAMDDAWRDSEPTDPALRHEEGGWIYMDTASGTLTTRRSAMGGQAVLDLTAPPIVVGSVVVGTFHTHPNPTSDGWDPGPSVDDVQSAWMLGVPCLIQADDGVYTTGPDSRRGGLAGGPGFPP